jgi:hypothetical protein
MVLIAIDVKPVVKSNLFIHSNIPQSLNENPFPILNRLAIRITRMIDQAGWIPFNVTVEIPLFSKIKI